MSEHEGLRDAVIVGAGITGVLAAVGILDRHPDWSVTLVDRHPRPGGRIRGHGGQSGEWGCGLRAIHEDLLQYWDQALKRNPEGPDVMDFKVKPLDRLGIVQAGKSRELPYQEAFSAEGAKAIGGGAAMRDWHHVEKLFESEEKGLKTIQGAFSHAFSGNRRSPSAVVLEHLARLWGIPDLWSAQAKAVLNLSRVQKETFYWGDWDEALSELLSQLRGQIQLEFDCPCLDARKLEDSSFLVKTRKRELQTPRLVIATSPWEASQWFPKTYWPAAVSQLITRTKPTSLVNLSCQWFTPTEDSLPKVALILAEGVQAWFDEDEVNFQVTLDYEESMQAPSVVKAVKKLRRAKKKLCDAFADLTLEGEYLALIPAGWTQPMMPSERRVLEGVKPEGFIGPGVYFCGDSYGAALNGDQNIVTSLEYMLEVMAHSD